MARKKHRALWAAGAAVGGFGLYWYVYRPWAAQRAALVAAAAVPLTGGGSYYPSGSYPTYSSPAGAIPTSPAAAPLPSPTAMLADPVPIGFTSLGPQYGGPLGACIQKKGGTWSPQKCQDRLNALVTSYNLAAQTVAQLQGQAQSAPNIASIDQLIAANTTALAQAQNGQKAALAVGDAAGAALWGQAVADHTADLNALRLQKAAAPANSNNAVAISAYLGQMAANSTDYFNLTGQRLA